MLQIKERLRPRQFLPMPIQILFQLRPKRTLTQPRLNPRPIVPMLTQKRIPLHILPIELRIILMKVFLPQSRNIRPQRIRLAPPREIRPRLLVPFTQRILRILVKRPLKVVIPRDKNLLHVPTIRRLVPRKNLVPHIRDSLDLIDQSKLRQVPRNHNRIHTLLTIPHKRMPKRIFIPPPSPNLIPPTRKCHMQITQNAQHQIRFLPALHRGKN